MGNSTSPMTTARFSAATGASVKKITQWLREGTLKGTKEAGKWMIPADQMTCVPAGEAGPVKTPVVESVMKKDTYSVEKFSGMTYLTPFGVTDWLKKGHLTGRMDAGGNWRVDATNLESSWVKRLLRG